MNFIKLIVLLPIFLGRSVAHQLNDMINDEILIQAQSQYMRDLEYDELPDLSNQQDNLLSFDDYEDEIKFFETEEGSEQQLFDHNIQFQDQDINSNIINFTTNTFKQLLIGIWIYELSEGYTKQLEKPYLVFFYNSQCKKCKNHSQLWDRLAKLQNHTHIGTVDCSQNEELYIRFSIKSFPTIIYFQNSYQYIYQGERTLAKINKFIQNDFKFFHPERIAQDYDQRTYLIKQMMVPSNLIVLGTIFIILIIFLQLAYLNLQQKSKILKRKGYSKSINIEKLNQ